MVKVLSDQPHVEMHVVMHASLKCVKCERFHRKAYAHSRLHVVLYVVLHVASVKGSTEQHGDYRRMHHYMHLHYNVVLV